MVIYACFVIVFFGGIGVITYIARKRAKKDAAFLAEFFNSVLLQGVNSIVPECTYSLDIVQPESRYETMLWPCHETLSYRGFELFGKKNAIPFSVSWVNKIITFPGDDDDYDATIFSGTYFVFDCPDSLPPFIMLDSRFPYVYERRGLFRNNKADSCMDVRYSMIKREYINCEKDAGFDNKIYAKDREYIVLGRTDVVSHEKELFEALIKISNVLTETYFCLLPQLSVYGPVEAAYHGYWPRDLEFQVCCRGGKLYLGINLVHLFEPHAIIKAPDNLKSLSSDQWETLQVDLSKDIHVFQEIVEGVTEALSKSL